MKMPFYGLKDVVSGEFLDTHAFINDGIACRSWLPLYSRQYPVKDLVLYRLGDFDTSTGEFFCPVASMSVVSWDAYKFPETPTASEVKESFSQPSK